MDKVLILGYGLLGKEIHKQTGWEYTKRDGLGNYCQKTNEPDIVINCIGYTNTYDNDRNKHWDANLEKVKGIIDWCNEFKRKYVHISTDYIYSGSPGKTNSFSRSFSRETDIPIHNNCWYSYTKLVADALVQLESNDYLICRSTHKPYPFPYDSAWIDQVGNFDYVDVIAGLIIKLINKGATGVYNVGTEKKTMYDLAKQTKPDVLPCLKIEGAPKDVTMNIDKLKNYLT